MRHACKLGLEGIVSKRKESVYRSGRSPDWLKMKNPACAAVKREAEEDCGYAARPGVSRYRNPRCSGLLRVGGGAACGHEVRLMPAQYVKAYVKRKKNDPANAKASRFCPSSCPLARARELLAVPKPQVQHADGDATDRQPVISSPCPCCGGQMVIIETFGHGSTPRHRPTTTDIKIDTS